MLVCQGVIKTMKYIIPFWRASTLNGLAFVLPICGPKKSKCRQDWRCGSPYTPLDTLCVFNISTDNCPFIDLPLKSSAFPVRYVKLLEGIPKTSRKDCLGTLGQADVSDWRDV